MEKRQVSVYSLYLAYFVLLIHAWVPHHHHHHDSVTEAKHMQFMICPQEDESEGNHCHFPHWVHSTEFGSSIIIPQINQGILLKFEIQHPAALLMASLQNPAFEFAKPVKPPETDSEIPDSCDICLGLRGPPCC